MTIGWTKIDRILNSKLTLISNKMKVKAPVDTGRLW